MQNIGMQKIVPFLWFVDNAEEAAGYTKDYD